MEIEFIHLGGSGDLRAAEIKNLHWLISSPKVYQVVIGQDGFPAAMSVPDPRSFSLHKLWLSKQVNRKAVKKQRDHDQAIAVANLVVKYLPAFNSANDNMMQSSGGIDSGFTEHASFVTQ